MLKKIIAQVKESVNEGKSLAFSLSQHPKVFSQIYINMVRAGEASGSLDLVLDRLAEFSERQDALRGRFRAALAYPVFMFFIGSVILFFLIRSNIKGIKEGKGSSRLFSLFTDILLLIVGLVILQEVFKDNASAEEVPSIGLLILIIIFPIWSIYALYFNSSSKEYMQEMANLQLYV